MKHIKKILTLGLGLGLLGGSLVGAKSFLAKSTVEAKAADHGSTLTITGGKIEIENSTFFSNWASVYAELGNNDPVSFGVAGATYNAGSLNAFGSFFDGCVNGTKESYKYTLKSKKWNQTTPYIWFEWGCARDHHKNEANNDEKLVFNFYDSANDDAAVVDTYEMWNDTFCGVTMLTRNLIIPDETLSKLANSSNFYMSVDFVDERTGEYGAHVFGNLHVSQNHKQVSDAQWDYFNSCQGVGSYDEGNGNLTKIKRNYYLNDSLRKGFVKETFATGFEDQLDTQASFEANFILDDYGNNDWPEKRHPDRAISGATYRTGSNMPFNRSGAGFFKGWYTGADDGDYGYVNEDSPVYRFISIPFVMPDNGIVSVKMAGNSASLHLIRQSDHATLAWVNNRGFARGDSNNIAKDGVRNCTMTRHVINFSKYAGELVQLGIADIAAEIDVGYGWTAAYFDEIKANYATLPGLKVDFVEQNKNTDDHNWSAINDIYVTSVQNDGGVVYSNGSDSPDSDTSPLKEAAVFVSSYMNYFRNYKDNFKNFCDNGVYNSDDVIGQTGLLNTYESKSEAVKRIICASDDYHRLNAINSNWWSVEPTRNLEKSGSDYLNASRTLGYSLSYLALKNNVNITVYGTSLSLVPVQLLSNNVANNMPIVIVVVSVFATSLILGLFFVYKKRKFENK